MKKLSQVPVTADGRMAQADITNANHLFGDPEYGDFELMGDVEDGDVEDSDFEGDPSNLYGDPNNLYGDPDPLSIFSAVSGDPEMGDSVFRRAGRWAKRNKAVLGLAAGGAAGYGISRLIKRSQQKKANQAKVNQMINKAAVNQTIRKTAVVQASIGKLNRNTLMKFFSLKGAKMNSSPIDPLSGFVMDMLKNMLDRQNMDTPFLQETAIGTFAAGTWTAQATGVATNRFYIGLIVQIGTNILNAAPGTVISMTASLPTIAGTLTIAATPFLFTYDQGFNVRFLFFPWQLVSNKPLPVLGQYANASPITITVTGIPAASVVNLIVPGSQHPWTVTMRNALIQ